MSTIQQCQKVCWRQVQIHVSWWLLQQCNMQTWVAISTWSDSPPVYVYKVYIYIYVYIKIKSTLNKTFEHAFHFVKENVWLQTEDFRHPRQLPNRLPDEDRLPIQSVTSNRTLFKRGNRHLANFYYMKGMHNNILLTGIFIFILLYCQH